MIFRKNWVSFCFIFCNIRLFWQDIWMFFLEVLIKNSLMKKACENESKHANDGAIWLDENLCDVTTFGPSFLERARICRNSLTKVLRSYISLHPFRATRGASEILICYQISCMVTSIRQVCCNDHQKLGLINFHWCVLDNNNVDGKYLVIILR